jgi:hypothetical protein
MAPQRSLLPTRFRDGPFFLSASGFGVNHVGSIAFRQHPVSTKPGAVEVLPILPRKVVRVTDRTQHPPMPPVLPPAHSVA